MKSVAGYIIDAVPIYMSEDSGQPRSGEQANNTHIAKTKYPDLTQT